MSHPNITYINFVHCELEGKWERITEEVHSGLDVYESLENKTKINVRTFSKEKTSYYMKKGARVIIKDHVLQFNKEDLSEED